MKNRQKRHESADEIEEGLELLFGSEAELSDVELEAELKELGTSISALRNLCTGMRFS